jgi:cell division protein FtsI/penicillin-binding protein 2
MLMVSGRAAYLQVVKHEEMVELAERQQQRTIRISPLRGTIYDRLGRELARSGQVESIFAAPPEMKQQVDTVARVIAQVLQLKPDWVLQKLSERREFVWIKRKVSDEEAAAVKALDLPGIHFVTENKRYYPNGQLAAHVVGYTSIDEIGLDGVELTYDDHIQGQEEYIFVERDARGRTYKRTQPPSCKGQDVTLTIDAAIQMHVEKALEAAVQRHRARSGVAIVLHPKTGEILALANAPSFNPNSFFTTSEELRRNRAIRDIYEPGSVFKMVTYAAALEEHLAVPEENIDCLQGGIVLAGHRIDDHKSFGVLSVREALENSSNVGAIRLGLRLGSQRLADYIRRFGFGNPTGIDLPGEASGIVRPTGQWSQISIGSISMGQEVGVTAIQMLSAMAVIANEGQWVQPHLIRAIHSRPSDTLSETTPQTRRVINRKTARTLADMLEGVLLRGTGKLGQLGGYTAAGKTGTAQQIDPETGRYSATRYVASFVGFAPVRDPQICVLVAIDEPHGQYYGGAVAAPVFKEIAEMVLHYLNVPPDSVNAEIELAGLNREFTSEGTSGVEGSPVVQVTIELTPDGEPSLTSPLTRSTVIIPDFQGLGLRAVAQECARLGLRLEVSGSGQAMRQNPSPGTSVVPGNTCWVEFSRF